MRHYLIPAASVLAAFVMVLVWRLLSAFFDAHASEPLPELRIEGVVSHVRDGDTIEVGDVAVRIANLDCAERDTEAGQVARERMAQLVEGKTVACELEGRRSYDREVGTCTLGFMGQDVGEALIVERACLPWWPEVPYLPLRQLPRDRP